MNILFASSLFSCLFFAAAVTISGNPFNSLSNPITDVTSASDAQLARIRLRLYTGATIAEYTDVLIGNATNLIPRMDLSKPTVLYLSGWTETPDSISVKTVMEAYLQRGDRNILLLDWKEIAGTLYPFAASSINRVGRTVAEALDKLVEGGLNQTTLHIVGHSLGAQLAGSVGRNTDFTVPRITGLDPAGPLFYFATRDLTAADAAFVDVIYTDAGGYGTAENRGTANFYPNGGAALQPGCPLLRVIGTTEDLCSHHRSWHYYAESLRNGAAFIGVKCDSYHIFESGSCSSNAKVVMGYATPTTARGRFFLKTNSASPFG